MDVAQALTNILEAQSLPGLLNLPGPSRLTYEYLLALLSSVTFQHPTRAPVVPKQLALLAARVAQNVWWPALSPDEVERRYIDDAEVPGDWDKVGGLAGVGKGRLGSERVGKTYSNPSNRNPTYWFVMNVMKQGGS